MPEAAAQASHRSSVTVFLYLRAHQTRHAAVSGAYMYMCRKRRHAGTGNARELGEVGTEAGLESLRADPIVHLADHRRALIVGNKLFNYVFFSKIKLYIFIIS